MLLIREDVKALLGHVTSVSTWEQTLLPSDLTRSYKDLYNLQEVTQEVHEKEE